MRAANPELHNALKEIAWRYTTGKWKQAQVGDSQGIPCPHPKSTRGEVQYLNQIMPNTNISPGHNAKKHQVSSPIYDISHDSSQPVKETTTSLNQTLTLQQ